MKQFLIIVPIVLLAYGMQAQNTKTVQEGSLAHDNLNFELWENNGLEDVPTGFIGLNCSQVDTAVQEGNYYLHLETKSNMIMGGMYPGMASIGTLSQTYDPIPGEPYTNRPERLTGFVRYHVEATDMVGIVIELTSSADEVKSIVASADTVFTGSENEWTFIDMELTYNADLPPDSIWIGFATGNPEGEYTEGSSLSLDNFQLQGTVSTEADIKNTGELNIYPNPATDVVTIEHQHGNAAMITLYSIDGRLQRSIKAAASPQRLSTRHLPAGNYLISISSHGRTPERQQLVVQ